MYYSKDKGFKGTLERNKIGLRGVFERRFVVETLVRHWSVIDQSNGL
jgi:hypothetical protein